MTVNHMPQGFHTVTPYLVVADANAALQFYTEAFGARELYRLPMGDKVAHAEFMIGDSRLMISDEWPDMDIYGPTKRGGATTAFMIYVPDVDAAFDRAVQAGGRVDKPIENQFYGDRSGTIVDPFGHKWTLATHVEDVAPEEMERRMAEWSQSQVS
jgi:PhnB protein